MIIQPTEVDQKLYMGWLNPKPRPQIIYQDKIFHSIQEWRNSEEYTILKLRHSIREYERLAEEIKQYKLSYNNLNKYRKYRNFQTRDWIYFGR